LDGEPTETQRGFPSAGMAKPTKVTKNIIGIHARINRFIESLNPKGCKETRPPKSSSPQGCLSLVT